jgi:hypothetical protein
MDDHNTEASELRNRRIAEAIAIDRLLSGHDLYLDDNSISWILNHIDCFVSQCQGNESIEHVFLNSNGHAFFSWNAYSFGGQNDNVWDKLGRAIGSLQGLNGLFIALPNNYYYQGSDSDSDEDEELPPEPILAWEILAWILRHVRQNVTVGIDDERRRTIEEVQLFARAICGHPTITSFYDYGMFPYESLATVFSTLTTLPALESVSFGAPEVRHADESTLANPGSLTELLRAPSLRVVDFRNFSFTPVLFQAAANALMEGTAVTKLEFSHCSFSAEESAARMASGLSRNTSVISISVVHCNRARVLFNALAAALPSNSTLQHLQLGQRRDNHDPACLSPVLLALGQNTGLKNLEVYGYDLMDESLCTAMEYGLGLNATLESLNLNNIPLLDESAALWCRTFSFLRTNKTLKSLTITLEAGATDSCVSILRSAIAGTLQENASLEILSILCCRRFKIKAEEYFVFASALQHNTKLKYLNLEDTEILRFTHDEDNQMAALLKKNYALEILPFISQGGDVAAILRLNAAGRRYLVQDGSSISKGVAVLGAVSKEMNCVFLHLLENPRLCVRSAVEATNDSTDNDGSTSPVDHIGMREHDRAQNEGKESRRRLT